MRKCRENAIIGSRAALAAAVLLGSPAASASPIAGGVLAQYLATYVSMTVRPVTSCADDGSAGTLRAVVASAGSGDTIDLNGLPAADPACTNSTITLAQGEIAIPHNMTLLGPTDTTLTIRGDGHNRVLNSSSADTPNAYLQIKSLTITRGFGRDYGGCIYGRGEVLLDHAKVIDCRVSDDSQYNSPAYSAGGGIFANGVRLMNGSVVSGNSAEYSGIYDGYTNGGGIWTRMGFNCTDSTISGNSAVIAGGGIYVGQGDVTLTRCTVDSNTSFLGGGIGTEAGPSAHLEVDQSTITGNHAVRGGGIYTLSPATISNSTIASNTAFQSFGGGIQSTENVAMLSSIVARNSNTNATVADIVLANGKTLSGSNNLVMTATVYPPGVIVTTSDPLLAPLGNHGGFTRTHALLVGSPAIGAGKNSNVFTTDQRGVGFAREVPTGMPDIGAYERQLHDDEIFYDGMQ